MRGRNNAADADDIDQDNVRSQTRIGKLTSRPQQTKEPEKSRMPGGVIWNPFLVSLIRLGSARNLWMSLCIKRRLGGRQG